MRFGSGGAGRPGPGAALPGPGPVLSRYGRYLTADALATRPIVGREAAVTELLELLLRWRGPRALIVGRPGVGKTALVLELARRLATAPPAEVGFRGVVQIDIRALVTGASVRGQVEERVASVIRELMSYNGRLVAVFEDVPTLFGGGSEAGGDFPRLFAPLLASSVVPCVATASSDQLGQAPDLQRTLDSLFQPLLLDEPGPVEALAIVTSASAELEQHHNMTIDAATREHAIHLAQRYLKARALPGSALTLLDHAAASARLTGRDSVGTEQVAAIAARWSRIPLQQLLDEELAQLRNLERILHRRVVGQEAAVSAVANAVRRVRARLADPARPVGSFLFLGPTGVGKTELARTLATLLFQDESAMVRLDMSEYVERHQVFRLIGAPPGYVGYAEGGQLTDAIRQRPYSVILLDELEKAHSDVFNLLLQIMEDGRLTDGRGQTVDFRHTVIIMTSNCGSDHIVQMTDASEDAVRERVMQDVRAKFKPEFLNRVDEIIVFQRLSPGELRAIVEIQVARLRDRVAEQGIDLQLTSSARDWLAAHGYEVEYGARPLRRLIRRTLEDPLALQLVSGDGQRRARRLLVDAGAGGLTISAEPGDPGVDSNFSGSPSSTSG